jgi:ribosome-associated protein
LRAPELAKKVAALAIAKKAKDVLILDLRGLTTMADFFVLCSGDSETHVKAIGDAVEDGMEKALNAPWHREAGSPNWVVLDFVDVVLHVFHKNTRSFYNLENLWGDAKIHRVADKPPLRPAPGRKVRGRNVKKPAGSTTRRKLAS